jgi:hypothetical protein
MRIFLCVLVSALAAFAAGNQNPDTLRGKLTIHNNAAATVLTADHKTVTLDGEDDTLKVLSDQRLNGYQIEAKGKFTSATKFTVGPQHDRSLLVRQEGKLKLITYWCDVCSIRYNTPGPCSCCQKELLLDLRDPDAPEAK